VSTLIALAATAALGFLVGRFSVRPTIHTLTGKIAVLHSRIATLQSMLRIAEHIADHDQLTGLPNRSRAAKLFVLRQLMRLPTTIALLDLDHFKRVNDTYSHHVGDDLLRVIAERLAQAVKPHGGTAARLAGDEFVLLLPADVTTDQAKPVAAILELLAEPATLSTDDGDIVVHPEASAGIAIYDGSYGTFDTMLHHADVALYHAKQQRGTHRSYERHLRMPRNASRHGPRRRDDRPADGDTQLGEQATR
jgi:diguanylate cyclase